MRRSDIGAVAALAVVALSGLGAGGAAETAGSRSLALNGSFEQASVLNYPDG